MRLQSFSEDAIRARSYFDTDEGTHMQDRIIELLRQVNAGTSIASADEVLLQRDGLIDVIETFPVTIELTLRGKRMLREGEPSNGAAAQPVTLRVEAEIAGGNDATMTAVHEIRQDGADVIAAECWTDAGGEVKRYEVRLPFSQFVHLALNTTAKERAAVDARADWRGVAEERAREVALSLWNAARDLLDARETTYHADGRATVPGDGLNALDEATEDARTFLGISEGAAHKAQDVATRATPAPLTEAVIAAFDNIDDYTAIDSGEWHHLSESVDALRASRGDIPDAVRAVEGTPPAETVTTGEMWTPKVGDRVVTVSPLTASLTYRDEANAARRAGATGNVAETFVDPLGGPDDFMVRHDDGTFAPYDADELRPVPKEST